MEIALADGLKSATGGPGELADGCAEASRGVPRESAKNVDEGTQRSVFGELTDGCDAALFLLWSGSQSEIQCTPGGVWKRMGETARTRPEPRP